MDHDIFKLFRIDFGLRELKVTFEDLIAAFLGSLRVADYRKKQS